MLARIAFLWQNAFARFLVVGALNTAFGWSVYAAFILLGIPRPFSLLGATVLGVLFNFQTIGRVVFGSARGLLLPRFVVVYAGVYLFNLALLESICRMLGVGSLLGQILALPPTVVVAFYALRRLVFRHAHGTKNSEAA
jgi:putative flippase GtrA